MTDTTDGFLLPAYLGSQNVPRLIAMAGYVLGSQGRPVLDASNLQFVDPLGIAVLGALSGTIPDLRIEMPWAPHSVACYMERMNVFRHCSIAGVDIPARGRNDRSDRLVELTKLTSAVHAEETATQLAAALCGHLTKADREAPRDEATGRNEFERYSHPLEYALKELLNNSLSHARRCGRPDANVWVAAQFYPSRGLVRVAVVDNGCGVLATLRDHPALREKRHDAAILTALQPRVSCNRDGGRFLESGNAGVGLTTTSRLVEAAGGHLTIVSGDGYHSNQATQVLEGGSFWSGVAIGFTMLRDRLPQIRPADYLPEIDAPPVKIRFT